MSESTWPGKPGEPLNPERDGWHLLNGEPVRWTAYPSHWRTTRQVTWTPTELAHWTYGEPLHTDAYLRAREAAGEKRGIERCAEWHETRARAAAPGTGNAAKHEWYAERLRALAIPDADALDAVVKEAEERGAAKEREACAKIADSFTCGCCGMDGKAGAAIRHRTLQEVLSEALQRARTQETTDAG